MDTQAPVLYRSYANYEVRNMSYSLAADIDKCGDIVKFKRFQGLVEKTESAAMKFGICVEDAVVDHMRFGLELDTGFRVKWEQYQDAPLKYSKNDRDWTSLNSTGIALMHEFESVKESLPLVNPEFTIVLPSDPETTWYNGTRLEYLADCISHPPDGDLLIDIKTSGRSYPDGDNESSEAYGYPALDPQLRCGALASGIRNVAFLVLVKTRTPKIQFHKGYVTDELLKETDLWLKEQYHRLVDGRLVKRAGVRFPDDHCLMCSYLPLCLGHQDRADRTLRRKSSKETEEILASLDAE